MAASSQTLATQAGAAILRRGGNAADTAIAMAAALAVTEPCSTGLGGDCFALYYDARAGDPRAAVSALNGSGRAPAGLTIELLRAQGLEKRGALADPFHAHAVTVPGACAGWCDLLARHGTMPLAEVLAPAISLAEDGFPVAPITSWHWSRGAEARLSVAAGGDALTINGRGPRPGETFRNPGLARCFRVIAEGGRDAFYSGEIGRDIAAAVRDSGGLMSESDLAAHASTWETPISTVYRGARVWECPPNGQGITALLALVILEGFDLAGMPPLGAERWHLLIEALRLAFADSLWHVADPAFSPAPLAGLLSAEYAAGRRRLIDPLRGLPAALRGSPPVGADTVYFCAVDGAGNACSFINSNYMGFGTGIVPRIRGRAGGAAPSTWGFPLQNRGAGFSLDPLHPNALAPGKRPYHTIIPGLLTREADGSLLGPFGVMGGFMQPQGHVQVLAAMLDDGCDPQAALDRPRFFVQPGEGASQVFIECGVPEGLAGGLEARGHSVTAGVSGWDRSLFGRGQIILRSPDGALTGGSDTRADGCAMGI